MRIRNAAGTPVTKATVVTNLGAAITQENRYTVDQFYYKQTTIVGDSGPTAFERAREILWRPGQVITQTELDEAFPAATFTSITPATGTTAGGTPFTIKGTNLGGTTGVTIGVAATSVVVVDDNTVTGVTGATTAGAKNVVIADDSGNVTATNAFTYA